MPTAQDLLDGDVTYETPQQRLRDAVTESLEVVQEDLPRDEALQALFPNTVMDAHILEDVVTTLLSGSHVIILGPPGSGKTTLAKDIWRLYPKEIVAVEDCPVQDDPFSLVDPDVTDQVPPCPICQTTYGGVEELGEFDPEEVDPSQVPVVQRRLREGYGFARVQGSPEVFPDHLTGSVNLARLEEIGDPNSPLVLEPGKLLQANRGILMIDEVGKLPRGTQNVLLQALQENQVTPSKSRETFPAHFVAVATSNLQDLNNITEPLNDRLTNLFFDFNRDHAKNLEIVRRGIDRRVWAPRPFQHGAARLVEDWRESDQGMTDLAEVGSNRSMVDILKRAEAHALMGGRELIDIGDFERGARDALRSRIRARGGDSLAEARRVVEGFVEEAAPDAIEWGAKTAWCEFYEERLNADKRRAHEVAVELRQGKTVDEWEDWVAEVEGDGADPEAVFEILDEADAFEDDD